MKKYLTRFGERLKKIGEVSINVERKVLYQSQSFVKSCIMKSLFEKN